MLDHKKLFLLLAAGIPPEHDKIKELLKNPATATMALDESGLTKNELLSMMVGDKHLFEEKSAWDSFHTLAIRIMAGGERFTEDDFTRPLKGTNSLIDLAKGAGKLDKLFDPEIFANDTELFGKLWFNKVPQSEREKVNVRDVRRLIAAKNGEKIREDVLADANITVDDMREAIKKGKLDTIKSKLAAKGDFLRAEDLVLLDKNGKVVYEDVEAWNNLAPVVAELEKNGQLPRAALLIEPHGVSKSLVELAADKSRLKNLFVPVLWQNQPRALFTIYQGLSTGNKNQVNIELLAAEIDDLNFGGGFNVEDGLTVDSLITPLNPDLQETGRHPVLPIGLPKFWSQLDRIREILAKQGETLPMAALREKSGPFGISGFRLGVQLGHVEKILSFVMPTPDSNDYLEVGGTDEKTISFIKTKEGLSAIFNATHWLAKPNQFIDVWNEVASGIKTLVNIDQQHRELHRKGFRRLRDPQ